MLLKNTSDILNASRIRPKENPPLASFESTGGRPAYIITKEMIVQLRETGMNWRNIATRLGISEQTLYRHEIEFGVENNFTDITDEELDRQIQQTLDLTPYSGETNVRGSLKGRGIDSFHDPIMQYVLGGSLHKNNTIYLPLGLYRASVN